MASDEGTEGWYVDPYGRHEQRWFSAGTPSRLVRDGAVEANDPPPDRPYDGPLSPARAAESPADGSDLRRADDAERGDQTVHPEAATDAWGRIFPQP